MTKRDAAERHLDVWASACWHRILGGVGYPNLDECLHAETEAPPAPPKVCDRADLVYEATQGKYHPSGTAPPSLDPRTRETKLLVDRTLADIGTPALLVGLLLWLYPEVGRFARTGRDREDAYRGFRPREWVEQTCGRLASGYLDRSLDRFLAQLHREFVRELASRL